MRPGPSTSPWSAATTSRPIAAAPGRDFGARSYLRPVVGLATVAVIVGVVALAVAQYSGTFTTSDRLTVRSDRAGLLVNPGAKVTFHGAQIGTVTDIVETAGGNAELRLAVEPARLALIPENASVEISAGTVFGAKAVEFRPPPDPAPAPLRAGAVLDSRNVTVEVNTIFEQLTTVLAHIDPAKLNETLGAISTAIGGRGDAFGQSLVDIETFLAVIEPSLPRLENELRVLPDVARSYADAAPDLMGIVSNSTQLSRTLVDEQANLDRFLVSSIGLATAGNDVIGTNAAALTNLMHLLVPTTALTNEYREALNCSFKGIYKNFALKTPGPNPGVTDLAAFTLGLERYRYPQDLPKVAASGGPQCAGQLPIQFDTYPAKVIADVGTNPYEYGNQGPLVNSDALKQFLFGAIDGPPRNSSQLGQPG